LVDVNQLSTDKSSLALAVLKKPAKMTVTPKQKTVNAKKTMVHASVAKCSQVSIALFQDAKICAVSMVVA
jgi:hypothetical protein